MIKFTRFEHFNEVGKIYELDNQGKLISNTIGNLKAANIETISMKTLEEFIPYLYSSTNFNHITAGINPDNAHMCVMGPTSPGIINRSNKDLLFPNSGDSGLLVIDSDGVTGFPEMPVFANHEHVGYTSSGSNIYNEQGEQLRGFEGCHTIYSVKDPKDIPRTMKALHQREILNYRGLCKVSASGTFLERSAIDQMLASPSQPIYFTPTLLSGLTQKKEIAYIPGIQEPIDTKKLVPNLTKEEKQEYELALKTYEEMLAPEMKRVREKWINSRVTDGQGTHETLIKSLDHHALQHSFIIHTKLGEVTVSEILADPKKWDQITCKDPIEPDYGSNTVAKIFSFQNRPMINSNAHGGVTYSLHDAPSAFNQAPLTVEQATISETAGEPTVIEQNLPQGALYPMHVAIDKFQWTANHVRGSHDDKAMSTIHNFKLMMEYYGIHVGYDLIAKDILLSGPNMRGEFKNDGSNNDLKDASNLAWMKHLCELNEIKTSSIPDNLNIMMEENQVNPVEAWIKSEPWDGQDRIVELFNTLTLADDQDRDIAWLMFRKWLIGACRIGLGRITRFEYVLCFQEAKGGVGKTRWFNKLCPDSWQSDGVIFDPSDKDSVKQVISYWLNELGELDSTFRSDIKKLMAFLTKARDEIRLPYSPKSAKFQRRTAFFGSVNKKNFLIDDSGDRRIWPISVIGINYQHEINMQQLWAQVEQIPNSEKHWLNTEENARVIEANKDFKAPCFIEEMLESYFSGEQLTKITGYTADNQPVLSPAEYEHLSGTEILLKVGIERPTPANLNKAGVWLRANNYKSHRTGKKRGYLVPAMFKGGFQ